MSKNDWGKPAYKGRPHPLKAANRFMLILVILMLLGFIQAGIKNGWFENVMNFIS